MSPIAQLAGALHGRAVDDGVFDFVRQRYTIEDFSTVLPAVPEGSKLNKTTSAFTALLVGVLKMLSELAPDAAVVLAVRGSRARERALSPSSRAARLCSLFIAQSGPALSRSLV